MSKASVGSEKQKGIHTPPGRRGKSPLAPPPRSAPALNKKTHLQIRSGATNPSTS